ncbi:MAG: phage tail tape measure protein, partial [Gemmatimonadota bacterium]|nr:phage tail tape measure protein [Gemmatimonadota bacterium]
MTEAANVESQIDSVSAAMGGLNDVDLGRVSDQMLDIGSSSKFSTIEVGQLQEQLAKSGLGIEDVLGGATQAAVDLAAATGEDLVGSGTAAAAMMNMFNLEGDQMAGVADTITAGLNASSMSLADYQRGVSTLGPVMANLSQYANDQVGAFEDSTAALAYFNSQGLKGAEVGTSLARMYTKLSDPTSEATAQMSALGLSAFDMEGNFRPLPDIMDDLNTAMGGLSDQAREQALAQIFGAEAADVMNIAIKKGGQGLRDYEADMVSSGQAAEQAAIRQDNFNGSLEQMGGAL